jgi:hypothetical protein
MFFEDMAWHNMHVLSLEQSASMEGNSDGLLTALRISVFAFCYIK